MVTHGINLNPNLIFMVNPLEIVEHPIDMPTDPKMIPVGPIENWLCYAVNFRSRSEFVGPFKAVVKRPYSDDSLYIESKGSGGEETIFWFRNSTIINQKVVDRPCWYQSSCTLRFIKERKYPHVMVVYQLNGLKQVLVPKYHIDVFGDDIAFKNETGLSFDCVVSRSTDLYDQYGLPYNDPVDKNKEYVLSKMSEIVKHQLRNNKELLVNTIKGLTNLIDGM